MLSSENGDKNSSLAKGWNSRKGRVMNLCGVYAICFFFITQPLGHFYHMQHFMPPYMNL